MAGCRFPREGCSYPAQPGNQAAATVQSEEKRWSRKIRGRDFEQADHRHDEKWNRVAVRVVSVRNTNASADIDPPTTAAAVG
jgi:hypothetical protein